MPTITLTLTDTEARLAELEQDAEDAIAALELEAVESAPLATPENVD